MKRFLVAYFFAIFFFLTFFSSGFVDSQDGFQYLAIARRIYYDHTFEMPLATFPDHNIPMSASEPVNGKYYSPTGLGYTLALLPAVVIEDLFNKAAGVQPIAAFPLQNDWPVLLFASMTNAVWGAWLVVGLYLYFRLLKIDHFQSVLMSFALTIGTNLLPYTKHTFAQMMFTSCLTWSFLLLKKYHLSGKWWWLVASGFSFGLVIISYNPTFLFVVPAFGLYYLALRDFKIGFNYQSITKVVKTFVTDLVLGIAGGFPLLLLYVWFNQVRFGGAASTGYMGAAQQALTGNFPTYVIIEGIWGLLFSPGKSIVLYSPILLVLLLFWFKLKRSLLPEIIAASTLFITYLWYIGTLLGGVDFLVWHGDSSWGPRYLLPVLPLLLVLVGYLYTQLSKWQKIGIFFPLILLGFGINFLGMVLPYQLRFKGLQTDAEFNNRNFNVYEYGNEIPRYAPAFRMAKILGQRLKQIDTLYDHGPYDVRLIDGFDQPFDLGWMVWRGLRPYSVISFDQSEKTPIETISVQIKNHQMDTTSSQSARFRFVLNGQPLNVASTTSATLVAGLEKEFLFDLKQVTLLTQDNLLSFESSFESSTAAQLEEKQALFLQILRINTLPQNIATIDYPYVSQVSKNTYGSSYHYWGNYEPNPWPTWHMHSGVYEQTFDFWCLRPFHYWDLPKSFFAGLFGFNMLGLVVSSSVVVRSLLVKQLQVETLKPAQNTRVIVQNRTSIRRKTKRRN
jgi:hypothetical protein